MVELNQSGLASGVTVLVTLCSTASASVTTIDPVEDVMTSAFFFGPNFVRGFAGDDRSTFPVASHNAFGVGPQTI